MTDGGAGHVQERSRVSRAKGPIVVLVLFVGLLAVLAGRALFGDEPTCEVLNTRVEGLDGFDWDNGFTSSGSEWISVLTDGLTEADEPSRRRIADAVGADDDGYRRFREALPDETADAADRLLVLVSDPAASEASWDRTAVERDGALVSRFGFDECGLI